MSKIYKINYQNTDFSFTEKGWFNATIAAERFGKTPYMWLRQRETVEYLVALYRRINGDSKIAFLEELSKIKELDGASAVSQSKLLKLAKKTGLIKTKAGSPDTGGGTWLHPKLAVVFARWLDIDFSLWCDEQIDDIIRNGISVGGGVDFIPLLLRPDVAKWELRFNGSYYHALAKATNTHYSGHSGGTPALYGQITDKWVYGCILPDEVHEELKIRKHKSEKMHQWLTDGGQDMLDKQIQRVTDIAASSVNIRDFEARMMQITGKRGQLSIIYPKTA